LRRREFITLLGGAAAAWPLSARAQQRERIRRIGIITPLVADDPEAPVRIAAFLTGLEQLGWVDRRNVRLDYRWTAGDPERRRKYAEELVALAPDIILAEGGSQVAALQSASPTVPIVFVQVVDPVGGGYVESLARPGSNATGYAQFEYSLSGKWLELLKEIAPTVTRAAVMRDPSITSGPGQFAGAQAAAAALGVELRPLDVRNPPEIERGLRGFARGSNNGLIVTASPGATVHRDLIIALAAQLSLPAIYATRYHVTGGGLMAYGPDTVEMYRQAAGYVDRIFKGERPADLPVQAPTKFELAINLKTAKALGLTVPPNLLATADEVIE
jgi:putative tryptophan/tyrosine transport system substrate-binding protein